MHRTLPPDSPRGPAGSTNHSNALGASKSTIEKIHRRFAWLLRGTEENPVHPILARIYRGIVKKHKTQHAHEPHKVLSGQKKQPLGSIRTWKKRDFLARNLGHDPQEYLEHLRTILAETTADIEEIESHDQNDSTKVALQKWLAAEIEEITTEITSSHFAEKKEEIIEELHEIRETLGKHMEGSARQKILASLDTAIQKAIEGKRHPFDRLVDKSGLERDEKIRLKQLAKKISIDPHRRRRAVGKVLGGIGLATAIPSYGAVFGLGALAALFGAGDWGYHKIKREKLGGTQEESHTRTGRHTRGAIWRSILYDTFEDFHPASTTSTNDKKSFFDTLCEASYGQTVMVELPPVVFGADPVYTKFYIEAFSTSNDGTGIPKSIILKTADKKSGYPEIRINRENDATVTSQRCTRGEDTPTNGEFHISYSQNDFPSQQASPFLPYISVITEQERSNAHMQHLRTEIASLMSRIQAMQADIHREGSAMNSLRESLQIEPANFDAYDAQMIAFLGRTRDMTQLSQEAQRSTDTQRLTEIQTTLQQTCQFTQRTANNITHIRATLERILQTRQQTIAEIHGFEIEYANLLHQSTLFHTELSEIHSSLSEEQAHELESAISHESGDLTAAYNAVNFGYFQHIFSHGLQNLERMPLGDLLTLRNQIEAQTTPFRNYVRSFEQVITAVRRYIDEDGVGTVDMI